MPTLFDEQSEWRIDALRLALHFLALDTAEKASYLPDSFPEVTFHMATSDMGCGNPLAFMAAFCDDACCIDSTSAAVQASLVRIIGVLSSFSYDEREIFWRAREVWLGAAHWHANSIFVWDALQFLAQDALRCIGWSVEPPARSCRELLDEFSDGAYSEVAQTV